MSPMDEPEESEESYEQRLNSLVAEYLSAAEGGNQPDQADFLALHPEFASDLSSFFRNRDAVQRWAGDTGPLPRAFGDYELLEELGRGGMGVVFKARQKSLNRIVALKMILIGQLASPEDVHRFRREAESAAGLDHPNIVPIYEVGEHEGQPYFTMKMIEGGSLADHLDYFRNNPRAAASLMATAARAVRYAHQRGILHRDLKPANILLDQGMQPHITDFGLAKRVDGDETQTSTGGVAGTLAYLAPERMTGRTSLLSWSVDVYGIGAVLYELLTARPPFRGSNALETLRMVQESEPDHPRLLNSNVDVDLSTICLKCLEKDPGKRYEAAKPLSEDLENWLEGRPILARPVGRAARSWRWCRRNPLAAALVGTGVALLVLVLLSVAEQYARRDEILESNAYIARHVASVMLDRMEEWGVQVEEVGQDDELAALLQEWNALAPELADGSAKEFLDRSEGRRLQEFCERLPKDRTFENWQVLDAQGIMVARTPSHEIRGENFNRRDYFQGTLGHAGKTGLASIHISSIYLSIADGMYKFDVCVPVVKDGQVSGVVAVSVTTDATMGIANLHDESRKAVLVAPWDRNRYQWEPEAGPTTDYLLLLHP